MNKLIESLVQAGVSELAESLFDSAVNYGEEKAEQVITDVTGLDIKFDREPNEKELEVIRDKNDAIVESLEGLKEVNRHNEKMKQLDVEEYEIGSLDVINARNHHLEMQESESWLTRNFVEILTLIIIVGSIVFFTFASFTDLGSNEVIVASTTKSIDAIVFIIIGYWFGNAKHKEVVK